ncbi:hypothetical protein QQF64_017356 [Cirrhinus molitorella]|uniref:Uncharacterized protein n=1 Tax=Cirrhinus molitorella TaxID=172907 RepID=A0ABR3LMG8_9TELE
MVETGATSHIINDVSKFKSFDETFKPETHYVELADGTQCKGVAQQRGNAEVFLIDSTGQRHKATLRERQTQTDADEPKDDYGRVRQSTTDVVTQGDDKDSQEAQESNMTSEGLVSGRYPTRERRKPSHLKDYVTDYSDSNEIHTTIDYCYKAVCGVPYTFKEAVDQPPDPPVHPHEDGHLRNCTPMVQVLPLR